MEVPDQVACGIGGIGEQTGRFLLFCRLMARLARIVVVNVPHHVTQRGNARQFLLASDGERLVYLDLLRQYLQLHHLSLLGYCLMSSTSPLVVAGLLLDVQPCASSRRSTQGRSPVLGFEANARTLCVVLERFPQVQRTCLAGAVLLLSAGRPAFVDGLAVRRIKSRAGQTGG